MIEVKEVILHCDHEGCNKTCYVEDLQAKNYENDGWKVVGSSLPYVEEWRAYCPIHQTNTAHSIGTA